jgi:biopolymer transport protein ExbD
VKSEGTGALKIIRYPLMPDMHQAMMASAETMTTAMNFIPMANVKIKALRDKMAQGVKLTAREQDYLGRIKKVPCLIKLALVEPPVETPPSAPNPVLLPVPPAPSVTAPAPAAPVPAVPVEVTVQSDGSATLAGANFTLDALKQQLVDISNAKPGQSAVVEATKDVPSDLVKKVVAICRQAKFKHVKTTITATPAPAATPATAPAAPSQPESPPAPPTAPSQPAPPPAPPAPPLPPVMQLPLNLQLRPDGKVDFQDATLTLDELTPKLEEIAVVTPNQAILIQGREKVSHAQLRKVLAICHEAKLAKVTVAKPAPPTAVAASGGTPSASAPAGPPPTASVMPQPHAIEPQRTSSMANIESPNAPIETGPHDTIP